MAVWMDFTPRHAADRPIDTVRDYIVVFAVLIRVCRALCADMRRSGAFRPVFPMRVRATAFSGHTQRSRLSDLCIGVSNVRS